WPYFFGDYPPHPSRDRSRPEDIVSRRGDAGWTKTAEKRTIGTGGGFALSRNPFGRSHAVSAIDPPRAPPPRPPSRDRPPRRLPDMAGEAPGAVRHAPPYGPGRTRPADSRSQALGPAAPDRRPRQGDRSAHAPPPGGGGAAARRPSLRGRGGGRADRPNGD